MKEENTTRADIKGILDTFNRIKPTPRALNEYCKRKGIRPISTDQFEDYLLAEKQDQKCELIFKDLLGLLPKLKFTPDFVTQTDLNEILDNNEQIELEVIKMMYERGVTYRDHDGIIESIKNFLDAILQGVQTRNTNMAVRTLKSLGEDKFGTDNFVMSDMADYLNERAGNHVSVIESKNKKKKKKK